MFTLAVSCYVTPLCTLLGLNAALYGLLNHALEEHVDALTRLRLLHTSLNDLRNKLAGNCVLKLGTERALLFQLVEHILLQLFAILPTEQLALDLLKKAVFDLAAAQVFCLATYDFFTFALLGFFEATNLLQFCCTPLT